MTTGNLLAYFEATLDFIAVANLLAHNNISQICYCGQISLHSAAVNYSFSNNLTLGGIIYFAGDGTFFSFKGKRPIQMMQLCSVELYYQLSQSELSDIVGNTCNTLQQRGAVMETLPLVSRSKLHRLDGP